MKKMLFISSFYPDNIEFDGVAKKINLQIKTFESMQYDVDYTYFSEKKYCLKSDKNLYIHNTKKYYKTMEKFYKILNKNVDKFKHLDVIYIRYDHINLDMLKFLNKVKKMSNTVIIAELPTYLSRWYSGSNLKDKINFIVKRGMDILIPLPIDYMLTFSEHKNLFGYKTINIENFVDFEKVKLRQPNRDNTVDLLALAQLSPAHGYDKVIKGLADYYSKKQPNEMLVILHIVGDGAIRKDLEVLAFELNVDKYIKFYGAKGGNELNDIFNKVDIGIGAIAAYRKGAKKLSELKIREYTARGLPFIYNAVEPQINNVEFAKKIPFNDENVNIEGIIDFYNKTKEIDIEDIRKFAEQNFSCLSQLSIVDESIRHLLKSRNK